MKNNRRKDEGTRLVRYWKSLNHAKDGIVYAFLNEQNLVIIAFAIIAVTIAGFIYNISALEWIVCVVLFALVLATELVNTSIEAVVDMVSLKENELAKVAKDAASGATLVTCIGALIIGLVIFIPKIF